MFGDDLSTFLTMYFPAAKAYLTLALLTFFWTIIFWIFLLTIEYKSFLRSREHYADLGAANIVSTAFLALAIGDTARNPRAILFDLYSAHPEASTRLKVAIDPITVLRPHLWYVVYLGLICGVVVSMLIVYYQLMQQTIAEFNAAGAFQEGLSYQDMLRDPALRSVLNWQLLFYWIIFLPFLAALGSFGIRVCLGNLLTKNTFGKSIKEFVLQGLILVSFLGLGIKISPATIHNHVTLDQATWKVHIAWTGFLPDSSIIFLLVLFIAYISTNLIFLIGLRRAVRGNRVTPPHFVWRLFIIALWIYMYLQIAQTVAVLLSFAVQADVLTFGDVSFRSLFLLVLGVFTIVLWVMLALVSYVVSRRGGTASGNFNRDRFAPWLYIPNRS